MQPATVRAWHRQGFQLSWRWQSKTNPVGPPRLDAAMRQLIGRRARENPTGGRRRIHAELARLDDEVAELTVAPYLHRTSPRPSPTWRPVLAAQARDIVDVDGFRVPPLTCRSRFVFVVLRHDRRQLLHLNVTDHPSAPWTARQIVEAFPEETASRSRLRARDALYGDAFARRVKEMGIREVLTAPRAPGPSPFVERVIGSIRRECLDHVLILNESHLRRLLRAYTTNDNTTRPHPSLDHNSPQPRIIAIPQVAGLHHRDQRAA